MIQRISYSMILLCTVGIICAVYFLVPPVEGLGDKVRMAFFHIPVAWVSVLAFVLSAFWALRYLMTRDISYDHKSAAATGLGLLFCLLATVSGAIFSKMTWGAYWNWDPRQTTIFILLLIYGASLALRAGIEDLEQRAKISAAYSLLSSLTLPFLVFIIPRYYFSLHPSPIINSTGKMSMDTTMLYILFIAVLHCTVVFLKLLNYFVEVSRKQQVASEYMLRAEERTQ